MATLCSPPRMPEVLFVRDLSGLGDRLRALGSQRVLIVSTASRRFVADVTAALAAFAPTLFDGARVHVPIEVVDAASAALAASGADTIVAVGGGSPIGLGKALRLRHEVRFVALPTTYAGSEMTAMYGITTGADKQTGRDPRVTPDVVVYDVAFTLDMPVVLTVQSLCNAMAHVISVLSTSEPRTVPAEFASAREPDDRTAAFAAVNLACRSIARLVDPNATDIVTTREQAQRAASACAAAFDRRTPRLQHALAHLLRRPIPLDHSALHTVVLPHF